MIRLYRSVACLCGLMLLETGIQPALAETTPRVEFVTLGTGGGPRVQTDRSQPANAVIVGGDVYLFDAGEGTQRQLRLANIDIGRVKAIFLSHHHIDHVGGLWPLLVSRWVQGHYDPLPVFGPPGTVEMVEALVAAARPVEQVPVTLGVALPAIASTIRPADLAGDIRIPAAVFQGQQVRVLAALVDHYHFKPGSDSAREARSYAFRIEVGDVAIVYSGDTGPSEGLVRLADKADLLVSEVIDLPAIRASLEQSNAAPAFLEGVTKHLAVSHLSPRQVGEVAARAGVAAVVLTHLVPGLDSDPNDLGYVTGLAEEFHGPVVVARDGQRFALPIPRTGD